MRYLYFLMFFLITSFTYSQYNTNGLGIPVGGVEKIEFQKDGTQDSLRTATFNKSLEFSSTLDPIIIEDSDFTGASKGQFSVSLTGAATYNLPIEVPPGINGIEPKISVSYNSQSQNGIAGFGWNISGLSTINKIGSNKYYDGKNSTINYSSSDRFMLDGQRLILKSGAYGMDGAEYQTETYSNLKITSHGSSQSNYGPEYFKIQYPDGSIAYYGRQYTGLFNSPTRTNTVYAITYITNPQNVIIKYTYINDNGNLLISNIAYGYRSTNPLSEIRLVNTNNYISFTYKDRNRLESGYVFGQPTKISKILDKITVRGYAENYKTYQLTYQIGSLGYEQLKKITETSGDGTLTKQPVSFNYGSDVTEANLITQEVFDAKDKDGIGFSGLSRRNTKLMSGNFSGQGRIGFLMHFTSTDVNQVTNGNNLYIYNPSNPNNPAEPIILKQNFGSTPFTEVVISKRLNHDNSLLPNDGWTTIRQTGSSTDAVTYQFNSYIYMPTTANNIYPIGTVQSATMYGKSSVRRQFLSGDFNGDGITEIVRMEHASNFKDPGYNQYSSGIDIYDTTSNSVYATPSIPIGFNYHVTDTDGDGYDEFIVIRHQNIRVYKFNQNTKVLELYSDLSVPNITMERPVYLGDFNGDGKLDFVTPFKNFSKSWDFYINKDDGSYSNFVKDIGVYYEPEEVYFSGIYRDYYTRDYILNDINNDGKTDIVKASQIVRVNTTNDQQGSDGITKVLVCQNTGFDAESQLASFIVPANPQEILGFYNLYPLIAYTNYNKNTYRTELAFITGDKLKILKSKKDNVLTQQLKNINEFDVVTRISYDVYDEKKIDLIKDGEDAVLPFVSFGQPISAYPKVDMDVAPGFYLVKKVTYDVEKGIIIGINNTERKQLFSYGDATINYNGKGFLGFKGRMTTNIYRGGPTIDLLNDQIKNVTIFDIDNNGLIKEEFVVHSTDWANFFTSPVNYITKKVNTYNISNLPNKVFKAQNEQSVVMEGLTGIHRTVSSTYDAYSNPLSVTETVTGGGENSVLSKTFTYLNNFVNDNYYVGRPSSKIFNMNGSQTSKENFSYANNLLTNITKQGEVNSIQIAETNEYDVFGNITKKTVSAADIQPRITSYVYDSTGRYIEKSKDTDGLETIYLYNKNKGWILSKTTPYGLTTSFGYNALGMIISETDYLGNITTFSYKTNSVNIKGSSFIRKETTYSDGRKERTTSNAWGNKTFTGVTDIEGNWINTTYNYDSQDRLIKKSEPYSNTANLFTTFEYDKYGRIANTVFPTGKEVALSYNGLSSTVDDGDKVKIETKNLNNQVKRVVDNGEVIDYTYNSNGTLKNTNYGGNIISFEYDGWGRKTKMIDPSAGTYTYEHNSIGDLLKETNPKGTFTHIYDDTGKISQITQPGNVITYIYRTDKLLDRITTSSTMGAYQEIFTYDSFKRISSKKYTTPLGFSYTYTYTFDDLGRNLTEEKQVVGPSGTDTFKTQNVYKNGYLWKLQNGYIGTDLKVYNKFNERGQVTSFTLGNGLPTINTYDQYGYLTQTAVVQRFVLTNTWDIQRGNLNARTNSLFGAGISETFQYDTFDRLISNSTTLGSNIINYETNNYDGKGRILSNAIGNYTYNSSKPYQLLKIENLNDLNYYQNNPLQQVEYNAQKLPSSIKQQGKENIYFNYDGFKSRTAMYYGNEAVDYTTSSKVRYYSPKGDIEVDYDKGTNKYVVNMYVDGDPYTADIFIRKENNVNAMYYLHRDYLGSILAITNSTGNIVEKRHFDAWGNVLLVQDAQNVNLTGLTFLDRGYTGHEHLQGVGLINMNARLYDSKLHRFLAPDNFIQNPSNSQSFNRYGYAWNNPLKFTDPSGEIFWTPILVGMAYGAIVGAAASAVVYSATALMTQQWSWNSFGKSVLFGAIGGAISGGLSGLAASTTSSFLQSTTYNMLSEVVSQVGANVIMGEDISIGTVVGSMAGAFVGAKMGQWTGVEGSAVLNVTGEIGYNSVKGGVRGAVAGGIGAAIDGDNVKNGIYRGTVNGMLGSAIQTTSMISGLGHTYRPSDEQLSNVNQMSDAYNISYSHVAFRKNGLYQLLQPRLTKIFTPNNRGNQSYIFRREVVWGRNIVTFGEGTNSETMGHEFGHIIQVLLQGWAPFQGRGIIEQLFINDPYNTPGTNEFDADSLLRGYSPIN